MKNLYAVATPKGRLCPDCAERKFGEELEGDMPDDHTIVIESDDWKHSVDGPCDESPKCLNFVG